MTYLDNDTLLCREEVNRVTIFLLLLTSEQFITQGNSDWIEEQHKEWDPVVDWFCQRYGVSLEPSTLITGPTISTEAREALRKHLFSYDKWALNGLMFGVESVKSLLLALACVDRFVTVEEAVRLSSLETEFQV